MQLRAPIRTTVAVAATTLAMTLLPAFSATASGGPVTAAAATCTHGTDYVSDGIRTWKYVFVRHYNIPVGTHYHVYNVYLRTSGPWMYQGQKSWPC